MKGEQPGLALLEGALRALREQGVDARIESKASTRRLDTTFTLDVGSRPTLFIAKVTNQISQRELGAVLAQLPKSGKPVIIAPFIPEDVAIDLRSRGVGFIDAAGNASLTSPGVRILISGRKRSVERRSTSDRAFRQAGIRLVFCLLSEPRLLSVNYREMASAASIALGGVPAILESLETLGFIATVKGTRRFADPSRLVSEWAGAYARVMPTRLELGRFSVSSASWWKKAAPSLGNAVWSGDVAANLMIGTLVPEEYLLYAPELPTKLLSKFRMKKDPGGRVVVRKRFWTFVGEFQKRHLAPPLLVYADLLANGDDRSLTTARQLYEEQIARSFA